MFSGCCLLRRITLLPVVNVYDPFVFFFFNDTATTEIYTLSLHDALPICSHGRARTLGSHLVLRPRLQSPEPHARDRKSTRLNSSHLVISYAVFCLKKKKEFSKLRTDTSHHVCYTIGSARRCKQCDHQSRR